jgi:hypothetical protein
MHLRYFVLIAALALPSAPAIARDEFDPMPRASLAGGCMANLGRALACLEDRVVNPIGEATAASGIESDWKVQTGISLFVAGNALTFSFPMWAMLGADVTIVTGVIIAGEVIEAAGILLMGDEAFDQLKTRFHEWRT